MSRKKVEFFPLTEKIKIEFTFFSVNTKNISSRMLEISAIYSCYALVKLLIFSTQSMKYINIKSKYPLYTRVCREKRKKKKQALKSQALSVDAIKEIQNFSY